MRHVDRRAGCLRASGAVWSADATAPAAGTRPAVTSLRGDTESATAAADASAQGNVAELTQMLHDGRIVEMRTTYNGSYGASLMFDPREMTYYVALFQDKHLWRVIRSQEKSRAEMVYANFVQQTVQLADIEIRRTELEAQKAFLERVIALQANRAQQLSRRALRAASRLKSRSSGARRRSRRRRCRSKAGCTDALRDLQEQVRQLEKQTETGLPAHNNESSDGRRDEQNPAKQASPGFMAGHQRANASGVSVRRRWDSCAVQSTGGGRARGADRLGSVQRARHRDQRERIIERVAHVAGCARQCGEPLAGAGVDRVVADRRPCGHPHHGWCSDRRRRHALAARTRRRGSGGGGGGGGGGRRHAGCCLLDEAMREDARYGAWPAVARPLSRLVRPSCAAEARSSTYAAELQRPARPRTTT